MSPIDAAIRNAESELKPQTSDEKCTKSSLDENRKTETSPQGGAIDTAIHAFLEKGVTHKHQALPTRLWSSRFPGLKLSNTPTSHVASTSPLNDRIMDIIDKRKEKRLKLKRKIQKDLYEKTYKAAMSE